MKWAPECPLSEVPRSPGFLSLLRGLPTVPAFEEEWEACARKGHLQGSEVLSEWSLCPQPGLEQCAQQVRGHGRKDRATGATGLFHLKETETQTWTGFLCCGASDMLLGLRSDWTQAGFT